jgi:hypothetical protein
MQKVTLVVWVPAASAPPVAHPSVVADDPTLLVGFPDSSDENERQTVRHF